MMSSHNYFLQIFVFHWIALFSPGANVLIVTHLAGTTERRLAVFATLGISTATLIWSSSALLGLSALLIKFPLVEVGIQILGALYLAHIGLKIFRSRAKGNEIPKTVSTRLQAYRLGFSTNILNPKSAVFFTSVFASTLPSDFSIVVGISAISIVMFNVLAWHLFLTYFFSTAIVRNGYLTHVRAVNVISGLALIIVSGSLLARSLPRLAAY